MKPGRLYCQSVKEEKCGNVPTRNGVRRRFRKHLGLTIVIDSRYSKTQLGIPGIYVTLIGIVVEFPWYRGLPE